MEGKKNICLGSSDYKEIACRYCYVDKTLLVKDLLDNRDKVNLITRPRRFGKSLNMSMLQTFFEMSEEDNSVYFRDKKIWKEGENYTNEQGKYPVIYISFLDANCLTWEMTLNQIENFISDECKRHPELETSDKVDRDDITLFKALKSMTANDGDYGRALKILERMLYDHYGVKPIVLIDEYDAPMQNGYEHGYYDEAEDFMKGFFSNGLKDKGDFEFAVLIGVLPVTKGSAYIGFSNPKTFTVLDDELSEDIGFTREEVEDLLGYYECEDKLDEVLTWYDGYNFGGAKIFNPLSVLEYIESGCKAKDYWVNTSSNSIIGDILKGATEEVADKLAALVRGETIECDVPDNINCSILKGDADNIFAILLMSGYLKVVKKLSGDVPNRYELAIANNEIMGVFVDEIMSKLQPSEDKSLLQRIWKDIEARNAKSLERNLGKYLLSCASYFDTKDETFYRGLCLGLCAYKSEKYFIRPNRESGDGRYDISLESKDKSVSDVGIVMELKCLNKKNTKNISGEAKRALRQITKMRYDTDLRDRGCKNIIKVGIAFLGKDVAVAMR